MITAITVLVALGFLGWGFYRARPFGKLGLVAWLQSVVLISPWLLFFGLSIVSVYLNIVSVLFLFLLSTGLYIYLGKRLRSLAQTEVLSQRATAIAEGQDTTHLDSSDGSDRLDTPEAAKAQAAKVAEALLEPDIAPIPADDLKAIQSIFGIDTFFATETIPYQEGVILRGNLRGDPEDTIAHLSERLQEKVGFSETQPTAASLSALPGGGAGRQACSHRSAYEPRPRTLYAVSEGCRGAAALSYDRRQLGEQWADARFRLLHVSQPHCRSVTAVSGSSQRACGA